MPGKPAMKDADCGSKRCPVGKATHVTSALRQTKWGKLPNITDEELAAVSVDLDSSGNFFDNLEGKPPGVYVCCHLCQPAKTFALKHLWQHLHRMHDDKRSVWKSWVSAKDSKRALHGRHSLVEFQAAWLKANGLAMPVAGGDDVAPPGAHFLFWIRRRP